jgi:hypothetical protein
MLGADRDHKVTVWSQSHTVTVYQKSKSVWIAVGTYMDETKEIRGRSAGTALSAWKNWATYKGN